MNHTPLMKSNSPIGKIESGVGNWFDQFWRKAIFAGLMLLVAGGVGAADAGSPSTNSLADLSLEDLVNLKVTSVSKKEEKLNDAAAAIFVLSNDDLRRSGATTVADALRLVPGLQVAAIDSGNWAVSARGFNSQFANKLLVMIDGRTVYSLFAVVLRGEVHRCHAHCRLWHDRQTRAPRRR